MTHAIPYIRLNIRLSEAQLDYLSYLYSNDDPEEALVQLLERDRLRTLRRAEQQIKVLHLNGEGEGDQSLPTIIEHQVSLPTEVANPIGTLQEYCQGKGLTMPTYGFETVAEGFCCTVRAIGLMAFAEARTKKLAKAEAAAMLLKALARSQVFRSQANEYLDQNCL